MQQTSFKSILERGARGATYVQKTDLDDSLSLNPNRCHHPLITQLTFTYL